MLSWKPYLLSRKASSVSWKSKSVSAEAFERTKNPDKKTHNEPVLIALRENPAKKAVEPPKMMPLPSLKTPVKHTMQIPLCGIIAQICGWKGYLSPPKEGEHELLINS